MIVKCFIRLTPGVVRHLVRLPRMNIYRGRPRPELAQTPSLGLIESRGIRNNFERLGVGRRFLLLLLAEPSQDGFLLPHIP